MTAQKSLEDQIVSLLREYHRGGVTALESSTIAKALRVSSHKVVPVLTDLVRRGYAEHAGNTDSLGRPKYKLAGGR